MPGSESSREQLDGGFDAGGVGASRNGFEGTRGLKEAVAQITDTQTYALPEALMARAIFNRMLLPSLFWDRERWVSF